MLCPVCNKQYPVSSIEQHANACITRTESILIYDSEDENQNLNTGMEEEQTENPILKDEDVLIKIHSALRSAKISRNTDISIHVQRGHCFADFVSFFNKKWNEPGCLYNITFIGEAGVDTGGVSREFYSECFKEIKDQYFSGSDEQGYEPFLGTVSIASGTAFNIGHLMAASLVHNGTDI